MKKVIITCAVTGAVHTPSMSPYLPKTPDEIAQAAIQLERDFARLMKNYLASEARRAY